MVSRGVSGRLVSRHPSEGGTPNLFMGLAMSIPMALLWGFGVLFLDQLLLTMGAVCGTIGLVFYLLPDWRPRVYENGILVEYPVVGERFYPWSMFHSYRVYDGPEGEEGHKRHYVLVLDSSTKYYIGHPMTDYQTAHGLIERVLTREAHPGQA